MAYAATLVDAQRLASLQGYQLLYAELTAKRARPAFVVVGCRARKLAVLAVRGTYDVSDAMIDAQAHGEPFAGGWAHAGMAAAARWLFAELRTPLLQLHADGYAIHLVGHSLGGGVASLLTVLLRPTLPDVRCVGFATPAAAAGGSLLASMRECVTSVVLRNDMVPRMTLSSVRRLFAELGAFTEWTEDARDDWDAVVGRLKSLWAPQIREAPRRSSTRDAPPRALGGPDDAAADGVDAGGAGAAAGADGVGVPRLCADDIFLAAPSPQAGAEEAEDDEAEAEAERRRRRRRRGGGGGGERRRRGGGRRRRRRRGDGAPAAAESAEAEEAEEAAATEEAAEAEAAAAEAAAAEVEVRAAAEWWDAEDGRRAASASGECPTRMVAADPTAPTLRIPGRLLHLYEVRGVYHGAWVPNDFAALTSIVLAPHMVEDHRGRAYLAALKAARAALAAADTPPDWVPFDRAPDGCACCGAHFVWESTLRSHAQQVCARHHCRRCGRVVCSACSANRACLPKFGIIDAVRVCDRCHLDPDL